VIEFLQGEGQGYRIDCSPWLIALSIMRWWPRSSGESSVYDLVYTGDPTPQSAGWLIDLELGHRALRLSSMAYGQRDSPDQGVSSTDHY